MRSSSEDRPRYLTDVTDALGADEIEIRNAGHLAKVMARLPAGTPVVLADTTRTDPRLREDDDRRTAMVAQAVPIEAPDITAETDPDDEITDCPAFQPAVQLGAVVVSRQGRVPMFLTVPLPAQQHAEEAVTEGELEPALAAYIQLLAWMASTLVTPSDDRPDYESAHLDRIEDASLRDAISSEAEQLDHAARRLAALHARVADYEMAAEIIEAAEEIVREAAENHDPSEPEDGD
ncbi:MAG TPA: hypothetical protein VFG35_27600 [Actinoplanes sp.]|nr:hypothetical protein [Actinoplanes sp.]